ncbi:MAG: hypothetical protein NTU83_00930 [Candidatus Hydrogenedentes bacterium]|nr:hypothetical protein [Candidatus Hydrogenedentota bacterium]
MTAKTFLNGIAHDAQDILGRFLSILETVGARYCVIGGLAVNAYVDPVVSLDLDVVTASDDTSGVCDAATKAGLTVERFEHSMNLSSKDSDLRIQLQTDVRYQSFLPRAVVKEVLGYSMRVACIEDVLQGKVWAYSDETRRRSKRQKDLADIMRLVETYPELHRLLPENLQKLTD